MLDQVKQFIPNILVLPRKRQFDILVYGYSPDNDELCRYNTKIMLATQNFIYDTKRFRKIPTQNQAPPAPLPTPPAPPAPPIVPLPAL